MEIRERNGEYAIETTNGDLIYQPQVFKGGGKRTAAEREVDLEFIANLYVKGFSQMEITDQLNAEREGRYQLTRQTVRKDISTIHKRWLETSINLMEQRIVIECQKLDRVEHEMWNLYERSQQDRIVKEHTFISGENIGDEDEDDKSGRVVKGKVVSSGQGSQQKSKSFNRAKSYERTETNIGDIEILKEIRITVMERSKLLGLGQTKTININWRKEAEKEGIDPEKFVIDATERILDAAMAGGSIFGSLEAGEEDSGRPEG